MGMSRPLGGRGLDPLVIFLMVREVCMSQTDAGSMLVALELETSLPRM